MNVVYPVLTGAIASRGIKKKAIAEALDIDPRTLRNKLNGTSDISLPEAQTIRMKFFPDIPTEELFSTDEETQHPA